MRQLGLILALTLVLTLVLGLGIALAAPGDYSVPGDYLGNNPPSQSITSGDGVTGNDTNPDNGTLNEQEGAKESVVFGVTPESAGAPRPDGTYDGSNANKSGEGTGVVEGYSTDSKMVRRAEGNDYVHGQFQTNTNACASCHQTHTAAGDALLIKNGIYNTCTACHDGTLGKLNVFDTPAYDATMEAANFVAVGGGLFGGAADSAQNASMHLPSGFLELAAAPGGNRTKATTDINGNPVEADAWTADFTCASCHQPHGSYSDRLLAPNPANIERQAVTLAFWDDRDADGVFKAYQAAPDGTPGDDEVIAGPWVYGENYSLGMTQTVVYDPAVATPDTTATPMVATADQLNEEFSINYAKGIGEYHGAAPAPTDLKVAVVPALVVKVERGFFKADGDLAASDYTLDVTDADPANNAYIQGLDGTIIRWTGEKSYAAGGYVATANNGGKNGITWFCAACHTDYYADKFKKADGSTNDLEGKYTSAYRHTINRSPVEEGGEQVFVYESGSSHGHDSGVLTCLSCHYAHGSEKDVMRDADDAQATTVDVNPSSALKRYVNMAVCWKCHSQQHNDELLNTDSYYSGVNTIKASNGYETIPQP